VESLDKFLNSCFHVFLFSDFSGRATTEFALALESQYCYMIMLRNTKFGIHFSWY